MSIKHSPSRQKKHALRLRRLSALTLLAPLSLTTLTACDQFSTQDILDILAEIERNQTKPSSASSFEMTDPNPSNHNKGKPGDHSIEPHLPDGFPQDEEKQESGEDTSLPPQGAGPDGTNDGIGHGSATGIIAEADLIQRRDNTLYALSQDRGLTVIDISDANNLKILGEHRSDAQAFEMYVQDGIVYAMMRNAWVENDEAAEFPFQPYQSVSAFLVLDAQDPANIKEIQQFQVPGRILDSRRVQDRVYVMSYQYSHCWGCAQTPLVRVTSFNVQDPKNPVLVQSLDLEIPERSWGPEPSLMSTNEHLYVALSDRASEEGALSSIRAIDISNPDAMELRADIPVHGTINARWQMNEYQDVLRVVTQPRWSLEAPVVETFGVENLAEPTKLGSLTMTLPRPEQLQSVRFDKDRAYAITFERTDPLFIIDLKNPEKPDQRGELEIPGWVYHMEPRGDRLLGIGFDRNEPSGHLHASLFDVSNMDEPTMMSRVNFGGTWSNFVEGQNQIHKALRIWDDEGLMAVPFAGGHVFGDIVETDDGDQVECPHFEEKNGVMLIDWSNDTLALRGELSTQGQARRSFLHNDNLYAVSTQQVASFDISNRDQPQALSSVKTTVQADMLINAGDALWLRRSNLYSSNPALEFDIVTTAQLDEFEVLGSIRHEMPRLPGCRGYQQAGKIFVHDGFVYVEATSYPSDGEETIAKRSILSFDIRDPQNPRFVQETPILGQSIYGQSRQMGDLYLPQQALLHRGSDLFVTQFARTRWDQREFDSQIMVYTLDEGQVREKHGFTRSQVRYAGTVQEMSNGRLASWYAIASNPSDESKITVHWQDIKSDADNLMVTDKAVPGVPLLISPAGTAMLAVGFEQKRFKVDAPFECYNKNGVLEFDRRTNSCTTSDRILHRVSLVGAQPQLLGSEPMLEMPAYSSFIAQSPERIAFSISERIIHPMPEPGIGFPQEDQGDDDRDDKGGEGQEDEGDKDRDDKGGEGHEDEGDEDRDDEGGEGHEDEGDEDRDDEELVGIDPVAPDFKDFPMPQQDTQILAIDNAGQLTRVNLPQAKGPYGGRISFLGPKDLLRQTNLELQRFDLSSLSNLEPLNYTMNRRVAMCSELLLSADNLVCAARQHGVFEFQPETGDAQ